MCDHQPPCPSADAPDRDAAHVLVAHPEQGWSLLCNGVVAFADGLDLLPSGRTAGQRQVLHRAVPAARARQCAGPGAARGPRPAGARGLRPRDGR